MVTMSEIKSLSRSKTTPIATIKSTRQVDVRVLTSMPAGKMVPIAAFPLFREDRVRSSSIRISFEMMETVETLMNAVNVTVKAYLVPHVAFERFSGFDELNRSYQGIPNQEGGPVTPYYEASTVNQAEASGWEIHKYLGLHSAIGDKVNTIYIETYNQIWNFRAKNRSKSLELRNRLHPGLAPAFWQHDTFRHVVPDFDQAVIDGQVALNVTNARLPVKGLGVTAAAPTIVPADGAAPDLYQSGDKAATQFPRQTPTRGTSDHVRMRTIVGADGKNYPDVWAELQANGITVSLSNIDLARKTQAFAQMRKEYGAHDDYLIDLLMDGITVPEQVWRQPILLADKSTVFGMAKRYATDGGNLTDSVVNGATFVDLSIATPTVPCGGVVMIVAEITPEQLFERQRDPMVYTTTVDGLPQYLRDTLDPEKVDVVKNGEVDTSHGNKEGVFGYAPLNWKWARQAPKVGGRYFRPQAVTTFDEDRQRIWAVETANPTLSADFYLCNAIHTKPFVVTNQDIGEALARGIVNVEGLTVFGGALVEANGDYDKVMEAAPQDRVDK